MNGHAEKHPSDDDADPRDVLPQTCRLGTRGSDDRRSGRQYQAEDREKRPGQKGRRPSGGRWRSDAELLECAHRCATLADAPRYR